MPLPAGPGVLQIMRMYVIVVLRIAGFASFLIPVCLMIFAASVSSGSGPLPGFTPTPVAGGLGAIGILAFGVGCIEAILASALFFGASLVVAYLGRLSDIQTWRYNEWAREKGSAAMDTLS